MMKDKLGVVILAAGLGKRMRSELPKVAVSTLEKPMICHVLEEVARLNPALVSIVTGYRRECVEDVVRQNEFKYRIEFAFQEAQQGTGHAVRCAEDVFKGFDGTILILYGDVPLISASSLVSFLQAHESAKATLSLISAELSQPGSMGRIVRNSCGDFERIVEARDCSPGQLDIKETNSGIYAVDSAFLWPAIRGLNNSNAQQEYYLTDIAETATKEGQTVHVWKIADTDEIMGVNSKIELARVNQILRQRQLDRLIGMGVEFEDPQSVFIGAQVEISPGVYIGPNVKITGCSRLETGVTIEGNAFIENTIVESNTLIKFGVRTEDAYIGPDCKVGPFAHLRPGAKLEAKVKVGNFVEVKNAVLRESVSASHLSYLGDADIGAGSNVGAGTITCNYDGSRKHKTVLGKNVFVGSNSALVAPVKIGDNATVGAGSTITKDVPEQALALTRAQLFVKAAYQRKSK